MWSCQVEVRRKRKSEKEQTLRGGEGVTGSLLDDSTGRGRAQKQDDCILKEQETGPKGMETSIWKWYLVGRRISIPLLGFEIYGAGKTKRQPHWKKLCRQRTARFRLKMRSWRAPLGKRLELEGSQLISMFAQVEGFRSKEVREGSRGDGM